MSRLSREEQVKESRPKRMSAYEANRNKLYVRGLDHDKFYYRWVNDQGDRIMLLRECGYELCQKTGETAGDGGVDNTSGLGSAYSKGVGNGTVAYLMRIPKEFWLEDQEKKERETAELEADMKRSAETNFYGKMDIKSVRRSSPTSGE